MLDSQWCQPGDLGGPGLGVGQSANAIRHSGVQCDLGGQLFRAEQHRAGTSVPNQRRQPADAPVIQGQTVFRRRKLEEGIGRDNPQVALHGKLQAGADGGTVDRADHWHRGGVHRLVQLDEPVGIIGGECVSAQVRASAERGALAGQHDRPSRSIPGFPDGLRKLLDQLGI